MIKKYIQFVALIMISLFMSSCGNNNSKIVSTIGNEKITKRILDEKFSLLPKEYKEYICTKLGKNKFIDAVVKEATIIKSAKKSKIAKGHEYKKSLIDFKKKQQEQYNNYKNALLFDMYVKSILKTIQSTDTDIFEYYNKNNDVFENPKNYIIKYVCINNKKIAEKIKEQLNRVEIFEKIIDNIDDNYVISKSNEFIIDPLDFSELDLNLKNTIKKLKNNEISEIIKVDDNYYITIKISEQPILNKISLNESKKYIKQILEKKKINDLLNNEKKKYNVKIYYEKWNPKK
jgi:hypothetical protein